MSEKKTIEDVLAAAVGAVRCEHYSHNEPPGCGNPDCWKYQADAYDKLGKPFGLTRAQFEAVTVDQVCGKGKWAPPTFPEGTPDLERLQGLASHEADWIEGLPTSSGGAYEFVWELVEELGFTIDRVGLDKHAEVGAKLARLFDKGQVAVLRNVAKWSPPPEIITCEQCDHQFPETAHDHGRCPSCGANAIGYD